MPRKGSESKKPTKPVRLHQDVADLAEKLAPIFGESVPDFLSDRIRPILEGLRQEGAQRLLGHPSDETAAPTRRRKAKGTEPPAAE
jgi:hypothetical protein